MCSCFLELCPLKKCFEIKTAYVYVCKMMFMYFWLNYCDENHVEIIERLHKSNLLVIYVISQLFLKSFPTPAK